MTRWTLRSISLSALFAFLLVVVPGLPVGAASDEENSDAPVSTATVDENGRTPSPPAANPDLHAFCGLDFVLVLDRSGSVASDGALVKGAAIAFLEKLQNTGSTVSLVSFAGTASIDRPPTALTSANLSALKGTVNGLVFGGSTNWHDALLKAESAFLPAGPPPLVVIVTDGHPNAGGGLPTAVSKANDLKAAGSHIFALGVQGSGGLDESKLQAISGPDEWPSVAFDKADWTKVVGFDNLSDALLDIATELCGGTVTVEKRVDGQLAGGWTFSATGGATPDKGLTDAKGEVRFEWEFKSDSPKLAVITETPKPGFVLESIRCTRDNEPAGSLVKGGVILKVHPEDIIRCRFDNRTVPVGIDILKTGPTQAHEGDTVTYRFTVTNTGEATLSNVVVIDNVLGSVGTIDSLAPGASKVLEKSYTVPAGQLASVVNNAKACGTFPTGDTKGSVCDEASHVLDVLHPAITIDKSVSPTTVNGSGNVVFTYVVKNTGDITLSGVTVEDDVLGLISILGTLEPGKSETVARISAVGASSPTRNIGSARGTDPLGRQVKASDDAVITIVQPTVLGATTTTTPTTQPTTSVLGATQTKPAASDLARTGSDPRRLLMWGAVLILAGAALLWRTRTRHA
jgi:hypothetical protein